MVCESIAFMSIGNTSSRTATPVKNKGSGCSVSGAAYERQIHSVVQKLELNGKEFNSQKVSELAGSGSGNDLECNFVKNNDIGIEAKKSGTPDWMQCVIKLDETSNIWEPSTRSKIPGGAKAIFKEIISEVNIYDGKSPPFMTRKITHEEWLSIKENTSDWDDKYYGIPNDTIKKLYAEKGCQYIQLSDGYGLYHLGNDICSFGVPEFIVNQRIRIRTKVHGRSDANGFCQLSVMAACQPIAISALSKSPFSLDDITKIPGNLKIIP